MFYFDSNFIEDTLDLSNYTSTQVKTEHIPWNVQKALLGLWTDVIYLPIFFITAALMLGQLFDRPSASKGFK